MPETEVFFYRQDDGSVPVLDWLTISTSATGGRSESAVRRSSGWQRKGMSYADLRRINYATAFMS